MKRSQIKRKAPRRAKDADRAYLEWIGSLPCVICVKQGQQQQSKTDAHHHGPRGLGQRVPDRQAIPLCHEEHHQYGREAVHVLGKKFAEYHGVDCFRLIELLNFYYDNGCIGAPYATILAVLAPRLADPVNVPT